MIEIDGSYLEGGGQILRTACSLSAITKKPCRVFNIRKNRPKPGLAAQHLFGINGLSQLCAGEIKGNFLGSKEINFSPGQIYRGRVSVNIPTAGSIVLALQALIPPALFSGRPINIIFSGGATDTFFSPTFDYFLFCFLKTLEKMLNHSESRSRCIDVDIIKRGYYPTGGAKVKIKILPLLPRDSGRQTSKLKRLNLTKRGGLKNILAISGASDFLKNKKVAERQIAGAREVLGKLKLPLKEKTEYYQTSCPGSQICLIAEFENAVLASDNLGKLGKRAEDVGKEAALALLKEQKSGACLDKHLADQILLYMALAPGKSQFAVSEITEHCKTNMWVIEKFLDGKFETKNNLISWNPN